MGFGGGNFILSYGGPDVLAHSYMTKDDIAFSENVNKTRTLIPQPPKVAYDEATKESQELLNTQLKDYCNQMTYKFILGQKNLTTDWDSYVKEFQNKGATKYMDTANSVYEKQKK
jgi:putative aldouronate transport system substrate-binding protein